MIEKQLIRLLLKKDFYNANKSKIDKSSFTNGSGMLYDTIKKAHEEYNSDISIDEIETLHIDVYNPAITQAARKNFLLLMDEIRNEDEPNKEIVKDILQTIHDRDIAQKIAVKATDIFNGSHADFSEIRKIMDDHNSEIETEDLNKVTSSVDELVKLLDVTTKYTFNISTLRQYVGGLGPGNFAIVFARPESGKTAFWVHLVGGPDGFASQGANVHALINEEPAVRTQMRVISAHTGMKRSEIIENIKEAEEKWSEIRDNVTLLDTVDWTLSDVDSHCEKYKPDILIIDQLDKVSMSEKFARTDEKLRSLYTGTREIAKRRQCCIIGISQASADAHNRQVITFDMLENSKTGKAAEADLIIGIGMKSDIDVGNIERRLCISKNKITGYHGDIITLINPEISRYQV